MEPLPTDSVRTHGRLRHIDALRGIAALLVLWRHVADAFVNIGPNVSGRWIAEWGSFVDVGRIGVVAFFLISGYVIPFSIDPGRPAPIGTFLIKRFFRIYPAYWVSVLLGAVSCWWIWGRHFGLGDVLVNLTLLQDFFGVPAAEGLYWTLLVELEFYLLCVMLLLLRSLDNAWRLFALAASLTAVYSTEIFVRWEGGTSPIGPAVAFASLNFSMMFTGTLYRMIVVEGGHSADRRLQWAFGGFLSWHLIALPLATIPAIGVGNNATIPYALGMLLFITGVSVVKIRAPLFDWLGRISYSLYLFHPVVFMSLLWGMQFVPAASTLRAQHLGIYVLVNALLSAALATLVYRCVERPGMEAGRRIARGWAARHARELPDAANVPVSAATQFRS